MKWSSMGTPCYCFASFLIAIFTSLPVGTSFGQVLESSPADGLRNNLNQPSWGIAGSNFMRGSPGAYSDGAYGMSGKDRPNPPSISLEVHSGTSGTTSLYSRNAFQAFYAQLVLDEIAMISTPGCPPEYEDMPLPDAHPLRNKTTRPLVYLRSGYNQATGYTSAGQRQQINLASAYIDGGIIYGSSRVWTSLLRSFTGGKLLADSNATKSSFPVYNDVKLPMVNAPIPLGHELKSVERLFRLGNVKGHENPFLLALQVIWFRWHNSVAEDIAKTSNEELSDEEIFQAAKRKVIAQFQKIALEDWFLAFFSGNQNTAQAVLPTYQKYKPHIQPDVTNEFMVAMDFRHVITPGAVWNLGDKCVSTFTTGRDANNTEKNVTSLRLCNNFWDPQNAVKQNLEMIIRGMLFTLGEEENGKFVSDFIEHYYGPYEYSRTDHVAVLLQRYRDHGLADLNTIRQAYDLSPLTDWTTLGGINGPLHRLYGGTEPENVDILTGGLMDNDDKRSGISSIFRAILVEQFTRLRDGDRFWYQNPGMFSAAEINEIESVTFKEILMETTNLQSGEIPDNVFLCSDKSPCKCKSPPTIDNPQNSDVDVCSPLATHDYIKGSEWSFALSFLALGLVAPASFLILLWLVKTKTSAKKEKRKRRSTIIFKSGDNKFAAREYLGKSSGFRDIRGQFKPSEQLIDICDTRGRQLRCIDMKATGEQKVVIEVSSDKDQSMISFKIPGDIDLILDFVDLNLRQMFIESLIKFLANLSMTLETQAVTEATLYHSAKDRDQRKKLLDKFFRVICTTAFETDNDSTVDQLDQHKMEDVINVKLTMNEFADAMGLQSSSLFVKNIFMLAEKENSRFMSFKEFLELFVVFIKGTVEQKGRMLFNIYDIHKSGHLTKDDMHRMIKSLTDLGEGSHLSENALNDLVASMFRHAGLQEGQFMTYKHFHKIFCATEYAATLQNATLSGEATKYAPKSTELRTKPPGINKKRQSFVRSYRSRKPLVKAEENDMPAESQKRLASPKWSATFRVSARRMKYPGTKFGKRVHSVSRYIARFRWQIFWAALYTLVTIGIFVERAYYFARGREHAGLRRMSGAWVTAMIRGSASVIMFTYSSLLLTMCRNTITALRSTVLHRFIPFDSAVAFHKYIAALALIGTLVHVVSHAINLYCMCTQTTASINCFFREYYTASDSFATFHYWAFQTITGLAGVLVTALIFVMYVFATQYSRRHVFKAFWFTHSLYWLVYILTFLHGIGRLVQAPLFSWYLIGPLVLFVLDRLQSISRNKVEIAVRSATPLPSGVLRLVFRRPPSFAYKSGQWVRIACPALSESEYHPFTLTSAPHEPHLSLHIRAVGPWTTNLRQLYSTGQNGQGNIEELPKLFLDGPFGEGHQDWYSSEVAVLVGGGIGVTPFASILKDIAFKSKSGIQVTCKKVYFIWVTRTQNSFEWLVDILRDVENADIKDIVDTHIFVTQFKQDFDLRTSMLYICERHFQKVEGKSLFTGLKARTHFGRPEFEEFFCALTKQHKEVSQVGVFSCGPGPMTSNVQKACSFMNSLIGPTFTHHFENF